jgi:act minimal PKS acyl carrier protein
MDDLKRIMAESAGETEATRLDGPVDDRSFEELGYDSLALLEIVARVRQELGVKLDDDTVHLDDTLRQAVEQIEDVAARQQAGRP